MGRLWEWGKWSVVVHVFEMFKKFEMTVRWPCGGVLVAATGAETGLGAERVAGEGGLGQSPPPCLALPAWLRPLSAPQVSFQHEVYPAEPATGPTGPAAPGQELEERPLSRQVFIVQELEVRDRLASSQINKFLYLHTSERMPRRAHSNMVWATLPSALGWAWDPGATCACTHVYVHKHTQVVWEAGGAWGGSAEGTARAGAGLAGRAVGRGPEAQQTPGACPLPPAHHQSAARGPHDQPGWA